MNDVPGAIGVLCGIMWHLAIPLVPVYLMAWDALLNNTYLTASIYVTAWILFYYTLICPHSTLVSKPNIWAYCRRTLSFLNSLLFASILGFVVSQFLISIAVNSIITRPIFIDDARLYYGPELLFEANITEGTVAINVTESEPIITVPVNTIPDFITVFGSPTQAVPTPAPVAKSTWTPAASSTTMPTPEPTPTKVPESEPEQEPEQILEPEPEPEQWIKPDEVFPVFQHMMNEYISQAKAVKACWVDLATEVQYIVIAIAATVVWALLPVLVYVAPASALTAVASYTSSLLFPILQEQGYTRDQSLLLCMALAVDITAIAASTLRILSQRAQTSRINATVDTSSPYHQQPIHTGQPVSNSTDQQIIYFSRPEQPEVDDNVRMYIEGLVKQHTAKLLQDAQLHAMITNAVLLAMQGPQATPMQAAAWQSINQHMWLPLVQLVHDKVTACFREQQQQQAHDDPTDAPSEGSSTGQRACSGSLDDGSDNNPEAYLGTRGDASLLLPDDASGGLLLENAPGASSGEGDVDLLADNATVASSREGAQGLDLDGDNDDADTTDTTSDNVAARPLADLDYLGEDGRILGEHLCRMFARLLNGDYPATKKTRRGLKPSQKRARDAAKAGEEAQSQEDDEAQHDEQPQQQASPEQDVQPEQESSPEPEQQHSSEQHDESHDDDGSEQQASPEQSTSPEYDNEQEEQATPEQDPEQPALPEHDPQPEQDAAPEQQAPSEQQVETEQHGQPEQEGAHSPLSTGDDVNGNNHVVTEPADTAPASEIEVKDSNSDEQGGDNNDTPIPTMSIDKSLSASPYNQERPSSSGDNHTNIDDGEVPTNITVDNQEGDNKDTPFPITPIKKGLASSRFAPNSQERPSSSGDQEAPSSSGGDYTNVNIDGGESHSNPTLGTKGGDNNDTPVPTIPAEKGLGSSRFADGNYQQPSTSGSDNGKVPSNPTAEHQSGDNKDTPLARTPVKKTGLAGSRFADVSYTPRAIPQVKEDTWASRFATKQPPTSGSDNSVDNHTGGQAPSNATVDSRDGDNKDTPLPSLPAKKKQGLAGSRFADDSYTPRAIPQVKEDTWASRFNKKQPQRPTTGGHDSGINQARDTSNGGVAPSTTTNGGQKGDNKDTPVATPPTKKGLGTSRWASNEPPISGGNNAPNSNAGATKTGSKPVVGMGKSRWASDQPPTSGRFTGVYADGSSQPRPAPPTAPTGPRHNPGLGGSQHNTGRPPHSGASNRRPPSPHGGKNQAVGDDHRASTPSSPSVGSPAQQPSRTPTSFSTSHPQEIRQDLSSTERLIHTSKYWHECLPDHRIVGKPDGKINGWYRTGNNLIDRGNAMIERGEKEGPTFKFPEDPEAAYRDPQPKPTTSSFDFPRPNHQISNDTAGDATPASSSPTPAPSKGRPICPPGLQQDLSSTERLRQTSKYWHECIPRPEFVNQPDGEINQMYRTEDHRRKTFRGQGPCVRPYKFPGDEYAAYRVPQPRPTSSPGDFHVYNHRPSAAAAGNGNWTPSGANTKNKNNNRRNNGNSTWNKGGKSGKRNKV